MWPCSLCTAWAVTSGFDKRFAREGVFHLDGRRRKRGGRGGTDPLGKAAFVARPVCSEPRFTYSASPLPPPPPPVSPLSSPPPPPVVHIQQRSSDTRPGLPRNKTRFAQTENSRLQTEGPGGLWCTAWNVTSGPEKRFARDQTGHVRLGQATCIVSPARPVYLELGFLLFSPLLWLSWCLV